MKQLDTKGIQMISIVILFSLQSFSQSFSFGLSNNNSLRVDSTINHIKDTNSTQWGSSFYISSGFGLPQGARFEIGYNFGTSISLGFIFGKYDNWSRDPKSGSRSVIVKVHLGKLKLTIPYLLYNQGITMIPGHPDTFRLFCFGAKINLNNWLLICPEIGIASTSVYISGGPSFFGEDSPIISDDKSRLGFNLSIELVLIRFLESLMSR